jgi:two-component system, NtrC family, sensor kinase
MKKSVKNNKKITPQTIQRELETIFNSVPAWIFYKDKNNRFIRVNEVFAKIMGLPKEKLEGRSLFDIYPKKQAENFWKDDKAVITSGKPKRNIIESVEIKKQKLWVQTDKIPYRDTRGNIIGIIGFTTDITECKQMEERIKESEEKFSIMFQYAPDAYSIHDKNGNFIYANKSFENLFGYKQEELVGKSFIEMNMLSKSGIFKTFSDTVGGIPGKSIGSGEFTLNKKDDNQIIVETRAFPVKIKGKTFVLLIIRDITERKIKEVELRKKAEELEEIKLILEIRVRARTHALQELIDREEQMIQERTKELKDKIIEMETFQKIAMGREEKILELKDKIKELEKVLKTKVIQN